LINNRSITNICNGEQAKRTDIGIEGSELTADLVDGPREVLGNVHCSQSMRNSKPILMREMHTSTIPNPCMMMWIYMAKQKTIRKRQRSGMDEVGPVTEAECLRTY